MLQALSSNSATVVDDVKQWLKSIRDNQPEMVDARIMEDQKTALHLAAQYNNVQVANLLLNARAGKYSSIICCVAVC